MFLRNNTNKQYSLRKLKKGTASVAVTLAVLGAGMVTSQTVKAESSALLSEEKQRAKSLEEEYYNLVNSLRQLESLHAHFAALHDTANRSSEANIGHLLAFNNSIEGMLSPYSFSGYKKALEEKFTQLSEKDKEISAIKAQIENLKQEKAKAENELQNYNDVARTLVLKQQELEETKDKLEQKTEQVKAYRDMQAAETSEKLKLEDQIREIESLVQDLQLKKGSLEETVNSLVREQQEYKIENDELAEKVQKLDSQIAEREAELSKLDEQLSQKVSEIRNLKQELKRKENMYEAFLNQAKEALAKQNKEIDSLKDLDRINRNLLGNAKDELGKLSAKNEQLSQDNAKLTEDQKVAEANRRGLRRDLEASREAKKKVEAELADLNTKLDKLEEDQKISEANRKGLHRDLEASREAKKKVEAELADVNAKLGALEKLNKELEDGKKLSDQEKAELQAKLEAETKALKEQIAKQAEEIAKLKEEQAKKQKEETPKTPEKPETKPEVDPKADKPAKPEAKPAAPKADTKKAAPKADQLPSTGESANPFFTIAALTVIAGAGMAVVSPKRKEN
ncbi:TPA: YSIRK-type signal peptide-containing protein [Streptococcus equi subsp. zooepidemicus]|nr:YSIRK-type signal peptide-containing protein [Streptococcus equi subsp. zooepidemicus]